MSVLLRQHQGGWMTRMRQREGQRWAINSALTFTLIRILGPFPLNRWNSHDVKCSIT